MTPDHDSIFALASGAGRAGVAVLRLSGPTVGQAVEALTGRPLPPPRKAVRAVLRQDGERLDDGLLLWFPGPASFTGEDVAELQIHGGRAVLAAVSEALLALGLRPAEAGEFSRRAFLNDKMDLAQAEAVADLVDAETAAQRRQALRQMDGALSRLTEDWRTALIKAQAHFEACIDFADEDIPDDLDEAARARLRALRLEMQGHLDDGHRGERLRDGVHVAILGAPNVGKSSLLNRLARREAAIVADLAGTTRDVIEVHLDLGGYPCVVADTAGLREATDQIESEGIRRALQRAEQADLKLVLFDAAALPQWDAASRVLVGDGALVVVNKLDRAPGLDLPARLDGQPVYGISAGSGQGLDALLAELERRVQDLADVGGAPALTRARHRAAVQDCVNHLTRAETAPLPELAAEDIRLAARALGRITGRVDVEDLLDVIFSDFCIGK